MKKQFSIFILTGLLFLFLRLTSLDGRITDMINVNNLSGVMDIKGEWHQKKLKKGEILKATLLKQKHFLSAGLSSGKMLEDTGGGGGRLLKVIKS